MINRFQLINKSFYLEMESILEEGSNKIMVSMHFYTIPTGVRDHYACHTFIDWGQVRWHVNFHQSISIYNSVVLINPIDCSTVTHIVLSTAYNFFSVQKYEYSETK